jgi:type IV pilus assembly protein PilO
MIPTRLPSSSIAWREHLRSPLTWHAAGFVALLLTVIGLGIRFGLDWAAISGHSNDVLRSQQMQLKALDVETAPLRGIDKRVDESRAQIKEFYSKRIPPTYSQISLRIGDLAVKAPVHLTRVGYSQGKPGSDLTEISMDAGVTGDYPALMRFINGVERDKTFFVIRHMTLTGQQGGQVNLRLTVSTWLRPADVPVGLPQIPEPGAAAPAGQSGQSEQAAKEGE